MFCVLWSRSWHVFLLRSRGMSVAAPSVVGVSQLLLSDSTLRECELLRFFNSPDNGFIAKRRKLKNL